MTAKYTLEAHGAGMLRLNQDSQYFAALERYDRGDRITPVMWFARYAEEDSIESQGERSARAIAWGSTPQECLNRFWTKTDRKYQ